MMMNAQIARRLMRNLLVMAIPMTLFAGAVAQGADEPVTPISPRQEEVSAPSQQLEISPPPSTTEGAPVDVQERGLGKGDFGQFKKDFQRKQPLPPSEPPAQLCHQETWMLTQCKCFSQTECQALTALFPNSCPPGSSHCEFTPMSRGAMPPLPPNLCSYQVPLTFTKCECHNQQECQLLTPFCQGSCPSGSTSCECTPMQRR